MCFILANMLWTPQDFVYQDFLQGIKRRGGGGAVDSDKWRFTVTMVMKFRVPYIAENSLTSRGTSSFSRKTVMQVFIYLFGTLDTNMSKQNNASALGGLCT